jgi:hypothetical protein
LFAEREPLRDEVLELIEGEQTNGFRTQKSWRQNIEHLIKNFRFCGNIYKWNDFYYFNPLFLLFNYHFYNLTTENNIRIFMITKLKFKDPKNIEFIRASRINDFTYIDNEN